jgi:engulfment/cell motility protein 1
MSTAKGDRIKLAIQSQPTLAPKQPLLLDFEQDLPLKDIIKDVCGRWGVNDSEKYAFMYADPPSRQSGKFGYITEENRSELADGDILRVALAPVSQAEEFYKMLSSGNAQTQKSCFDQLPTFARDGTFASEFIRMSGMPLLIQIIEKVHSQSDMDILLLKNMLASFEELMEHGQVQWTSVTEPFISKLISLVVKTRAHDLIRAPVLARCFSILQSVLVNHSEYASLILRNIRVEQVMPFLSSKSETVQQTTLALINGMLLSSSNPQSVYQQLKEMKYGRTIQSEIIDRPQSASQSRELSHQLYVYQQLLLNQYEKKMSEPFAKGLSSHEQALLFLQQSIPEEFSGRPISTLNPSNDQVWKQLGFTGQNPFSDLAEVPPGVLALEFMVYFARNKRDTFVRLLLTKDNPCPFAQASIRLTKMLCQIFKVGESPSDIEVSFLPPLVGSDSPFEELFCVTIQLLYKTWREMRAGELDFEMVMHVVQKQITTVIQQGHSSNSFENLRQRFFEYSYRKIVSASEEKSQLVDDSILKAKPVIELREAIMPEIQELIRQQRLRYLVEGDFFPKVGRHKRGRSFYCRLSPNLKVLHYGDAEEGASPPSLDALKNKIPVSEMSLTIGKDCPHVKSAKGRPEVNLAFSIFFGNDEHLDFSPSNDTIFSIWVDGLSILCSQRMVSKLAEDDLNTLLVMEMKLRLLDVENVSIPSEPPVVPPDPPNYDFFYKLD